MESEIFSRFQIKGITSNILKVKLLGPRAAFVDPLQRGFDPIEK